jgi:hypothetical protein
MWPLAIVAGTVVNIVAGQLAARCSRTGWTALTRLLQFIRWPALTASVLIAIGLARHAAAWPLALAVLGGALTGLAATQASYAVYRFFRAEQHRRGNQAP